MGGHSAQKAALLGAVGGRIRQSINSSKGTEQVPFLVWASMFSSIQREGGGWTRCSERPSCQWLSLS